MGVCPCLEYADEMLIYCLGYGIYNYGALFNVISLSIYDVMYDIITMGVCPCLEYAHEIPIYCLGYDIYNYGPLFNVISLSIYDVIYDIIAKPYGTLL